uniref:Major facilitator superfamily (MFS) profile domain-containing protein n=1 Tax=Romanomermis culicivorax TaxID=13658 RepID=A0A915KJD6_ROMCU
MSVSTVASSYSWSKTDSGMILSCFFWGYVCVQAVAGHLADTYGGEKILAIATLVWSGVTLASPFIFQFAYLTPHPIALIVASRILLGLAQGKFFKCLARGFHFPTIASLIAKSVQSPERAKLFGLVMAGSHVGTVICGSAGSLILETFGWEPLFFLIGIFGIFWWTHFQYVYRMSLFEKMHDNDSKSLLKLDVEAYGNDKKTKNAPVPLPWGRLLRKTSFWAAFCAHFCGANAYFTLFSWMPSYFSENYSEAKGWVFNFLPNLAIMTTSMLAPSMATKLCERGLSLTLVRKIMEGTSQIGIAICLALASASKDYELALFSLSAAMALRGLHHGGVAVNPQDFAPNHTGAVFGLMNMASALPGFIGVYTAGYILETYHSWSYVFSFTASVCLLGVAVYSAFGTSKQII